MRKVRIFVFIFFALVAFAGNSLLCRLALRSREIDPSAFTTVRLLSGALILTLLAWAKSVRFRIGGSWMSAVALFIYAAGFSWAYLNLSAATGALILFGSVQMTMIFSALRTGERMSIKNRVGCLVALLGLVILLLPGLSAPPVFSAGLMCAAGIGWGVYSLRGRKTSDALVATAGNFVRSLPLAAIMALLSFQNFHMTNVGLSLAIISGAVTSGIGYAIWYSVLPHLTATQAATLQLSVPVLAILGAGAFLNETLTLQILVSAMMILAGISLVLKK
jgi:drug/metabolite transporter (DMT)-like permease